MEGGWIGVDLDGTLAHYTEWNGGGIGAPIAPMVDRVKRWLAQGRTVKVFTARVGRSGKANQVGTIDDHAFAEQQAAAIRAWCLAHLGAELEVTATKDFGMIELWDDRAVQVVANTGEPVGHSTRGLT